MVIDIGREGIRVGYSGDDTPRAILPTHYGQLGDGTRRFGEEVLGGSAGYSIDIRSVYKENGEPDWPAMEALLRWGLEGRLGLQPSEHPVLLVDDLAWSKETREGLLRLFFDGFQVPALLLGRAPVLAAFSLGKHTGLVVDLGAGALRICPVFDGFPVRAGFQAHPALGGAALTAECEAMLHQVCPGLFPQVLAQEVAQKDPAELGQEARFQRRPGVTLSDSFRALQSHRALDDFKESTMQVPEASFAEADLVLRPPKYYEFASGFNRNFGLDRFRLGEILFQPDRYRYTTPTAMDTDSSAANNIPQQMGLTDSIIRAVQACDVDVRSSVISNLILCGGGASLAGLSERLSADLNRVPTFGRVRVQAGPTANERRHAAWIGGSILASLGSFQQLWLTRQEYAEHGPSYIERKSP